MKDAHVAVWQRSTKCEGGACVEVADLGDAVGMRNSTDAVVALSISIDGWRSFVAGVRAGEFDRQAA